MQFVKGKRYLLSSLFVNSLIQSSHIPTSGGIRDSLFPSSLFRILKSWKILLSVSFFTSVISAILGKFLNNFFKKSSCLLSMTTSTSEPLFKTYPDKSNSFAIPKWGKINPH